MKKILRLLSIIAIPAFAQTPSLQWEKSINGVASGYEQTQKAWKDPSGNFYIIGTTSSDAFVIKTDVNGNVLLKLTYDGPLSGIDYGYDVKADAAGNIYLAGVTQYNSLYVSFITKFNSTGVKLWEYIEPNNIVDGKLTAVILDNYSTPANVYFTGSKNDTASTTKINSGNGAFIWRYMYNPGKINDIDIDNNGRPLICGYISNYGLNNPDLFADQLDINTGYPMRYYTLDGPVADT